MHFVILILAWITPAVIAGILGWPGTWGSGSALGEYLVPVPVAGGVMHVPSFVVLTLVVLAHRRPDDDRPGYLPALAFAIAAATLAAMIDFERLNSWLFTDYQPSGSPLRLDGNPLFLFIFTDACWAGYYLVLRRRRTLPRAWLALPLLPALVIGSQVFSYSTGGPQFKLGPGLATGERGEQTHYVYTSAAYDEAAFRAWLDSSSMSRPWSNPNTEHVAVLFTRSMEMLKRPWQADPQAGNVVATFCLYEEDRAVVAHAGYQDCFSARETVEQTFMRLRDTQPTGYGKHIDSWYAYVRLCDDVAIPAGHAGDLAREGTCQGVRKVHLQRLQGFIDRFGEDSAEVQFVRTQAAARAWLVP